MNIPHSDPYITFPTMETAHFNLRLVHEEDAADLLACYSDPLAFPIFNSDNCTSDFRFQTLDAMKNCIGFWTYSYSHRYFVRPTIIEKSSTKGVGTLEFFARPETFPSFGKIGVLRLDIVSRLENESTLSELLNLICDRFYALFGVENIVTKAVPEAVERRKTLSSLAFTPFDEPSIIAYPHYFVRRNAE